MEKYQENIKQALRNLKIADHMTYVTYPLINEKKLLLKILNEIHKSIINIINTILNHGYLYKKIKLYQDREDNLQTFFSKCVKEYNLTHQEINSIKEILNLNKKHKSSPMEFVRKNKIVIMEDNLNTKTLDIYKIKEFLEINKKLLLKTTKKIKSKI